jgi:hypothetical protein
MVKAYFRYEPAAAFGVIVSGEANIVYDSSGKHLLAPALEKVGVWQLRQGLCTKTLAPLPASRGPSLAVTSIASSPSSLVEAFFLLFFFFLFSLGIGLVWLPRREIKEISLNIFLIFECFEVRKMRY